MTYKFVTREEIEKIVRDFGLSGGNPERFLELGEVVISVLAERDAYREVAIRQEGNILDVYPESTPEQRVDAEAARILEGK